MRVGLGYDVHRLVEDRKLILGGVEIHMKKVYSDILMQMYCFMPLWMLCLGQRAW